MARCPRCNQPLREGERFCPGCGLFLETDRQSFVPRRRRRLGGYSEAPEKRFSIRKAIGVVCIIVALCVLISIWNAASSSSNTSSSSATDTASAPAEVSNQPQLFNIGDAVRVGYWSYKVNGIQWTPILVESEDMYERPDATFLVVDLSVRNEDSTASVLPPLNLVNASGQKFDESSAGSLMQGFFGPLKQLNPTVASRGFIVFDVPRGDYRLVLSGGITSTAAAQVDLSVPAAAPSDVPQQPNSPASAPAQQAPTAQPDSSSTVPAQQTSPATPSESPSAAPKQPAPTAQPDSPSAIPAQQPAATSQPDSPSNQNK
jgi:hypothetical protein